MNPCEVYFIIDNKYAKELIKKLMSIIRDKFVNVGINPHISSPVNVCNDKMGRFIEWGLEEGYCVIIVVDTEGVKPDEVKERIISKHFKDLGINDYNRVKIILAHPCLEAWLAELLNLNVGGATNCRDVIGVIKSRIKDEDYDSYRLPGLIERYLRDRLRAGGVPSFLSEFIDAVKSCCGLTY
jgi:hypothetical protein